MTPPDHEHEIVVTARRWPFVPFIPVTNTWKRVCRCKEADEMICELLDVAESRPEQRMVLTLRCDARPHPQTYISEGTRW